jgi:hypothetical protein
MKWQPIETAPQDGREILASKWAKQGDRMVCVRDPFMSFWSASLGKFQYGPTHWSEAPETPDVPQAEQIA